MNRPLVIRQIVAHVANRRVTPYRLRTVDAVLLLAHIERLEAKVSSTVTVRLHPDMSVSLEPEERVLGDVVGEFAPRPLAADEEALVIDSRPTPQHHARCMIRDTEPMHAGPCPLAMAPRTKSA